MKMISTSYRFRDSYLLIRTTIATISFFTYKGHMGDIMVKPLFAACFFLLRLLEARHCAI